MIEILNKRGKNSQWIGDDAEVGMTEVENGRRNGKDAEIVNKRDRNIDSVLVKTQQFRRKRC